MTRWTAVLAAGLASTLLLAACGGTTTTTIQPSAPSSTQPPSSTTAGQSSPKPPKPTEAPVSPEAPVPAESNPPGDIPDNTAFVPYRSKAGGFTVSVPEGWARTTDRGSVTFTDKLNTVQAAWLDASAAPTVASTKRNEIPALEKTTRAFRLVGVAAASLPAGSAVLVTYQANSEPNPVTGRQYRQDVERFELFHAGREVVVTLLSPVGADNVDPWRIVTESIKWN